MNNRFQRTKHRLSSTLTLLSGCAILLSAPIASADELIEAAKAPAPKKTADWYKDEECRRVFFAVIEGLYRDGISQEIVDLVIGGVEANNLEQAFIFRCKLCHACYEAFAVYQRRPAFNGADGVNTIGKREIPKEVIQSLKTGGRIQFDNAFATIVQPWVKAELHVMLDAGADRTELLQKFVKLAEEGNALIPGYGRCQACDAISDVAMAEKKKTEK